MDYNITFRKKDNGIQAIVSYKNNEGKWKQKSKQGFSTQKAAKPWVEKTVDDLKEKIEYVNPDCEETTFKELFDNYIKHIKLYNESKTITNYNSAVRYFKNIEKKEIDKISDLDIQECIDDMVRKGLKSSSIESYTIKIKTIFKYAVEKHIIKENPTTNVKILKDKLDDKENIKALTKAELKFLLSKIKHEKHYLISLIAATCGLRIGEILGLTWDKINEKEKTMTVNRQWKVIENDPVKYGFGTVKSKNSNRIVPIPPKTMSAIKKYKKNNPIDINNRIFPYARTDSCGSILNNLYKKIGYNISVHDLRHTYASTLVASGLDFKTVAELMGHDVSETIDTYSHFTKDMMTRAKKVVNSIF